jgi:hypothetical protein
MIGLIGVIGPKQDPDARPFLAHSAPANPRLQHASDRAYVNSLSAADIWLVGAGKEASVYALFAVE